MARDEQLIVRRLPSETLIYDLATHRATCLDERATAVWDACNGEDSLDEIKSLLLGRGLGGEEVDKIFSQLADSALMENVESSPVPVTESVDRRQALTRFGVAVAASAASVISLTVPTPAQAASGDECTDDDDCPGLLVCLAVGPGGIRICVDL